MQGSQQGLDRLRDIWTGSCVISKLLPCEKAREGYSWQRQQHIKGSGIFCKVERGTRGGLLGLSGISERGEGWASGQGVGLSLDGHSQILVSHRQHLNTQILFYRHWGVKRGLWAEELHSQVRGWKSMPDEMSRVEWGVKWEGEGLITNLSCLSMGTMITTLAG